MSNGEELGDPLCQWSQDSGESPQFDTGITHPGIPDLERSTASLPGSTMETCSNFTFNDLPADYISTSFIMPSYEVPTQRTTYAKYAIKVDDVEDMYSVRFDPVIDQTQLVHHILLYNCDSEPDGFLEPSTEEIMPCTNLVFAWAIGGKSMCLPPKIGFGFAAASPWYLIDGTYMCMMHLILFFNVLLYPICSFFIHIFIIIVHYDNPNGIAEAIDNSGIQVTRFPKTSVSDQGYQSASYLWVGADLDTVSIPPKRAAYEVTAECKFDNIPPEGITVFSYLLHGHQITRKVWTEVQRPKFECPSMCQNSNCETCFIEAGCCGGLNDTMCFGDQCCDQCVGCQGCERCYEKTTCNPGGTSDLASLTSSSSSFDLGCNTRYDFDLQETVPLGEFQKIYADDVLTTHCVYDSSNRTSLTLGGDATEDEMCIAFYLFYPSPPNPSSAVCLTTDTKLGVGDGAHICNIPGQIGYDDRSCRDDPTKLKKSVRFQSLSTWLQVHILTMYIAWGFVLPIGVLIPMSFRRAFEDKAIWFKIHRFMQTIGVLLLIIGCSVAFANVKLHFHETHQTLGLAVFVLALFQPFNAILRPSHKINAGVIPRSRKLWEIMHKNLGRAVIIMAWVNMILGARLLEEWYSTSPILTKALVGLQGAIIVVLTSVAAWRYINMDKDANTVLAESNGRGEKYVSGGDETGDDVADLNLNPIA